MSRLSSVIKSSSSSGSIRKDFSTASSLGSDSSVSKVISWLESLPLSKTICKCGVIGIRFERDLSDGYLVAEAISNILPNLVELHNFSHGTSSNVKRENWLHLRRKVLSKMGISLSDELIEAIVDSKPGAIVIILKEIYNFAMKIETEKREAEEERIRAAADPPPLELWRDDHCLSRMKQDGSGKDFMIGGKLVIEKEFMEYAIKSRDEEISKLKVQVENLSAQVSRLRMTVDLKEERLNELTHQLSIYQREECYAMMSKKASEKHLATSQIGSQGDVPFKSCKIPRRLN